MRHSNDRRLRGLETEGRGRDEACSSPKAQAAAMTAKQPQIFAKTNYFIAWSNFRASPSKA
jgi:hypothetical protein